ncbi:DNA circularization protein [Escherichia marmotae]|uniref:DNA circularization protein n=1 Tax=Escherichia TaxID=561 RepID=UPI0007A068B3|nr:MULTISPECIES: DNA circularization N-terminal domain-containing protein [Escherichia]EHW2954553.1 DNA circularization protein [Escherichia coli]EIQ9795802.1 DNA circularization protein [Escherichia coli]EJJ5495780.1 DNA circularization protein [Escherichia coli]EJZ0496796.1 DNA circularization protein [Escherichia coli]KYV78444.1 multidrug DMT transporter permease [Escherichia coli]
MGIITDAVADTLGLSSTGGWDWQSHINQASFRGVPFGVISGESVVGRRVAVHEYPYRDTVWVEDLGRSARKFTLRGFLIQDSLVYSAGDVFSQRDAMIAACETSGGGLLVHPTLGEMTVYVPDGGLRIEEGVESGRVFSFMLTVIESGEKAFSLVTGTSSTSSETWYQTLTTTAAVMLAAITGEMNSVTGAVKTIKSTVSAWETIFSRAVTSVTSMTSTVSSLFSPDSYGRYCTASDSGTASGSTASSLSTWLATTEADDDSILETIQACSVRDRSAAESAIAALDDISSVSGAVSAIQAVITTLAEATGSDTEKIRVMAEIASAEDGTYYEGETACAISASVQAFIRTLGAGAMLWRLMQYTPQGYDDAVSVMRKARTVTEAVLLLLADAGDDDSHDALNAQYTQFVTHWQTNYLSQQDVMKVTSRSPQPSLALANRLYQDAARADELVQAASPVHPAFMPLSFTARNS